jgi:hypothetical protein
LIHTRQEDSNMNTRMLVIAAAVVAIAAPAGANARTIPVTPLTNLVAKTPAGEQTAKKVAKKKSTPRVLCICFPPRPFPPPLGEEELRKYVEAWQRQYDQDLIDHGLEPVYGYVDPILGYTLGLPTQLSTPSE